MIGDVPSPVSSPALQENESHSFHGWSFTPDKNCIKRVEIAWSDPGEPKKNESIPITGQNRPFHMKSELPKYEKYCYSTRYYEFLPTGQKGQHSPYNLSPLLAGKGKMGPLKKDMAREIISASVWPQKPPWGWEMGFG